VLICNARGNNSVDDNDDGDSDAVDLTAGMPPPDYAIYSGCARSAKHIEQAGDAVRMYLGGRAVRGFGVMGCIKDVKQNYADEPFDDYLRKKLGLGEDCPIERISPPNKYRYGFIRENSYNIQSGCSNGCAYCMGHYVDDREPRSADPKRVIEDLQKAYAEGLRILKLSGENTALFGVDTDGKPHLHELIQEISKIGFTSVFINNIAPQNIYPELVETLKTAPTIDGIVLSIETPDEGILQSVGRGGGTADVVAESLREIRTEKPWFYAEARMITGLPGETDETHEYAKQYLRDNGMIMGSADVLHSHKSLPVSKLPNQVDAETAERRKHELYLLNQELIENYMNILRDNQISMPLTIEAIFDQHNEQGTFKSIRLESPFKFNIFTTGSNESKLAVGDKVLFSFYETATHQFADSPEREPSFHIKGFSYTLDGQALLPQL